MQLLRFAPRPSVSGRGPRQPARARSMVFGSAPIALVLVAALVSSEVAFGDTESPRAVPDQAAPTKAPEAEDAPADPVPAKPAAEPAAERTQEPLEEVLARALAALDGKDPAARAEALAVLRARGGEAADGIAAALAQRRATDERLVALLAEIDPARSRALGRADEPWYLEKVRRAAERLEQGDPLSAIHHLEAILVLEPRCPIRGQLRQMVVRAKELHVRQSTAEARLIPSRVLVTGEDALVFTIEVENVGQEALLLDSRGAGLARVKAALELEIFSCAADGGMRRARHLRQVDVHLDARVEPGQTVRTEVSLKAFGPDDPFIIRRARVTGTLRPETLILSGETIDRFLPLFAVDVFVAHPRRLALAADPVAALADGLGRLRAPEGPRVRADATADVLFAAMLAPPREHERVLEMLVAALQDPLDPAGEPAIIALSALNGEPVRARERWLRWDQERRR